MIERGKYNIKILFLALLIIILIFLAVLTYTKDCKENTLCFIEAFKDCKKAELTTNIDNSIFTYEILGENNKSCVTTIHLLKIPEKSDEELKKNIEGKGMVCEIPQSALIDNLLFNVKEVNVYCTGPLREVYLQVTIEKLYSFLVSSLGGVTANITEQANLPSAIL